MDWNWILTKKHFKIKKNMIEIIKITTGTSFGVLIGMFMYENIRHKIMPKIRNLINLRLEKKNKSKKKHFEYEN